MLPPPLLLLLLLLPLPLLQPAGLCTSRPPSGLDAEDDVFARGIGSNSSLLRAIFIFV
jgi:hypothetical protein